MKIIKRILDIFTLIVLAFSVFVFSVLLYVLHIWPDITYEQIMVTMHDLSMDIIVANMHYHDYIGALLFFAICYPLFYFFLNTKKRLFASLFFICATLYFSGCLKYYYYQSTISTLYEEEYVYPQNIQYKFPEKKRNLILIYLESFEQNFSEAKYYQTNLIPNLTALQQNGGQYSLAANSYYGTDYSIASLFSSHCGIPLRYLPDRDIYATRYFVPNAVCFSEILHQNGYQTSLIKAADITFTNAHIFAKSHGYEEALGVDEIIRTYPEDQREALYGTFGGIKDEALFAYAKKHLADFSSDRPFLLTLFSLDTHGPTSYSNPSCKKTFNDIRDTFMCTDNTVNDFIAWLKESPYWENTTVVIMGDHLIPRPLDCSGRPHRGIYNVFLNLPDNLKINPHKAFSTFDIAPSILDSLGIQSSLNALGLGRSLFSDEETLTEKLGYEQFNIKLQQKSEIYDNFNKPQGKHDTVFTPYTLGHSLTNKHIPSFTDVYENFLDVNYVDQLNLSINSEIKNNLHVQMRFNIFMNKGNKLIITANNHDVYTYLPPQFEPQPFLISFEIPKQYITDGKLQLKFRNTAGIITAMQLGIAIQELILTEKD